MIDMMSYLSELCSFLVLGMISYNIKLFDIHWKWLVVCILTLYICHYASITGILATFLRKSRLLDHPHVFFYFLESWIDYYFVYCLSWICFLRLDRSC